MQVTAVYACVRILAEAIAGLPLCVYRYTEDGSKEKVLDHPLYALLHEIIVRACTLLTENINIILKIFQYQQENPLQERNTY